MEVGRSSGTTICQSEYEGDAGLLVINWGENVHGRAAGIETSSWRRRMLCNYSTRSLSRLFHEIDSEYSLTRRLHFDLSNHGFGKSTDW